MKLILKLLVYSNLWVGLAVACLAAITTFDLLSFNLPILIFIGTATALVYSYMRLVQLPSYQSGGQAGFKSWYARHPLWLISLTVFWGLLTAIQFLRIYKAEMIWLLLIPGLVSLLYPLGFRNAFGQFTSLRSLPGIKVLLIAMVWSYVTVALPALAGHSWSFELGVEFVFRSLLIVALIIPFDIRDSETDPGTMMTLPQKLGIRGAVNLSLFLLLLYQLWVVCRVLIFTMDLPLAFALILGLETAHWLIHRSSPASSDLHFSFWIEGVPVFTFGLMWLVHSFF